MKNKSFSIGEELKAGWIKFKQQPFTWIFSLLLVSLLLSTHPIINHWIITGDLQFTGDLFLDFEQEVNLLKNSDQKTHGIFFLVSLLYFLIQLGFTLSLIYMGIRAADGLKVNIFHIFSRFHRVFQYAIAYILFSLMILAGLILLLFPAGIWGSKYSLYGYFIADKGVGPIEAFKRSSQATYGSKWDIFGFLLINVLLVIAGTLTLFIGLLVVYPVIIIAWGYIYRKLSTTFENPEVIRTTTIVTPQPAPKIENKINQ